MQLLRRKDRKREIFLPDMETCTEREEEVEMNIQLTDREVHFLKQYAEVYESEREIDFTAQPIVVVEFESEYPADIEFGYDRIIYAWDGDQYDNKDQLEKELKEKKSIIIHF